METIKIDLDKTNSLIPAIIQDNKTKEVYMLGYMNKDALEKTQETGIVYFWSRSRNRLWMKGEISGNILQVQKIVLDCDKDTLLILVALVGKSVCHTGKKTCFNTKLKIKKFIL